jgi:hypothetical protein
MNCDILERPFEAALIKSRRGQGGKTLSYVEGAEYIRRLNEAFESRWSFEVVEHQVLDAEVPAKTGGYSATRSGSRHQVGGGRRRLEKPRALSGIRTMTDRRRTVISSTPARVGGHQGTTRERAPPCAPKEGAR